MNLILTITPLIILLVAIVGMIFLLLIFLAIAIKRTKHFKNQRLAIEGVEVFRERVDLIKHNEKFTEIRNYFSRVQTWEILAYLLGIAFGAALIFSPIFEIKVKMFGVEIATEKISLFNDILLFFEHTSEISEKSFVISVVFLVFIVVACCEPIDLLVRSVKRKMDAEGENVAKLLTHIVLQTKIAKNLKREIGSGEMLLGLVFLVLAVVAFSAYMYWTRNSSELIFSYMSSVNSVSLLWLGLTIFLLVIYIMMIFNCRRLLVRFINDSTHEFQSLKG